MRHHKRTEALDWSMAEVNEVQLMFCIQTHALDTLEEHVACARGTDYYPSLRAAHASTSNPKHASGVHNP